MSSSIEQQRADLIWKMVKAHNETISHIIDYLDSLGEWVDEVSTEVNDIEGLRCSVKESRKQINESQESIKTLETEVEFLLEER